MKLLASPRIRLFVGAALISLSPVWVRLVSVSPTTSGFYRVLFGALALAVYLIVSGRRVELSSRAWKILVLASVFFSLDLWFWHRSINYIGPGLATLLANFQVFFMMLGGALLLRQAPAPAQIAAVPLALVGLALIVGVDWQALSGEYRLGVLFGLLTAVSYAAFMLCLRASRRGSKYRIPTREVAVVSVGCTLILGATAFVEGQSLAIGSLSDAGWLVAYGVLSHCLGWLFIASSLPQVTAAEAGLALLLQPALSFGWDVLLFARPLSAIELLGAAVTLFAIYLGSRGRNKQAGV